MPMHPNSLKNLRPPARPGEVRNPKGRGTAGASLREWLNSFSDRQMTAGALRKIAKDESEPWTRRAAANRALRAMESPDLSDFAPYLDGSMTLDQLRESGVPTDVIKKAKVRIRTDKDGTQRIEREIELIDRSGQEFDRIADRTEGTPKQKVDLDASFPIPRPRVIVLDSHAKLVPTDA